MRKLVNLLLLAVLLAVTLQLVGCYSCQSWHDFFGSTREEWPPNKVFWDKDCKLIAQAPSPAPKPAPVPVPKPAPKPAPASSCGPYTVTRTYPCGDCGVIKLEKTMPREVTMNAPFTYEIRVTNLTDMMVTDVMVTENLDANFKYSSSAPSAKVVENKLMWTMDELEAGATKTIKITGMATAAQCIKVCATMTYVVPACANVQVIQPALRLTKTAPSEVLLCDPIQVKMVVTNTGSGDATEVKVVDNLPAGLMTSDGKKSVTLDAGTLAAGQSKEFSVSLKAEKTGKYVNTATVSAAGGLKAEASTTTVVHQPVLVISKSGPEQQYLGKLVSYEIEVTNKGDAPATNTVIVDTIPAGVTAVKADAGGEIKGSNVIWNIGTLAVGDAKTVSVSYIPAAIGTVSNTAKATAVCTEDVSASAKTTIAGIAAILLEVVDIEDPIEMGNTETYVITATNQGSAADTNIKIVCTLEDSEQYVSSSGASRGVSAGNTVTFDPLPTLAPKAQATWHVTVKALKAGDIRFTVVMTSDQLTRPVQETEATHLYE